MRLFFSLPLPAPSEGRLGAWMGGQGLTREGHPLHLHLTLARLKRRIPLPPAPPREAWTVDHLHLVESIQGADGARHETRFLWPLGGSRA